MKTSKIRKMIRYHACLLMLIGLIMGQSVMAQGGQITASGTVLDENNEPIIGASVVLDNDPSQGMVTDYDGNFSLSVPAGSSLRFSYVGYKNVVLRASSNMNVKMESTAITTIEVEITGTNLGYGGTIDAKDVAGATTTLGAGKMNKGVVTSSEQLLRGKIAGLSVVQGSGDPTKGAVMRLRGGSSLSGDNGPLIVVDGVAGADMNSVQSTDIIAVDVLKDASAAAIYGSRGANGVIIVTTKRKDKDSRTAQYNGYIGIAQAAGKLDLLESGDWDQYKPTAANGGASTDWQKEAMQTAITHSHALTFSNSSEKGGFKGSISYMNSEGVVLTSQLERLGATLSGYTSVWNDRLHFDLGVSKNKDDYTDIDNKVVFDLIYSANPTFGVKDDNGNYTLNPDRSSNELLNPVEVLKNRHSDNTRNRFLGYFKTELDIFKGEKKGEGLKGTLNLSYTSTDNQNRYYLPKSAMYANGIDNGLARREYSLNDEKQLELYFNYNKTFKELHKFNAMAGYSYSEAMAEGFGGAMAQFDIDDFLYNSLAAGKEKKYMYSYKNENKLVSFYARAMYSYMGKYMLTGTVRGDGSSKFGANNKWGVFPSGAVAWRITEEKFMSGTKEWLNNLKLRVGYGITGNQGGIAPYSSLLTYKPTGATVPATDDEGNPIGDKMGMELTRNANEDLKWESTGQLNIGLDFEVFRPNHDARFFRNLSGTIDFYQKDTKDLLYFYKVGAMYPKEYMLLNVGNLKNTGIEVSLNLNILSTKDFSWDFDINMSHNKNEVVKLSDSRFEGTTFNTGAIFGPKGNLDGMGTNYYSQQLKEGYSVGSFFGAKTAGVDENGNILYITKDKYGGEWTTTSTSDLSDEDRNHYLGCAMPKFNLGLGMSFSYKRFDASINGYGMFGQKVYNATAMELSRPKEYANVLKNSVNKNTTNFISDYWLEDASFFRLQNITVGYTFDLKKINMNSLRVYATVENVFVLTGYSGVDPEVSIDMDVTQEREVDKRNPGIDCFDNYPKPRTFMFGVNLQF